MKKTIKSLLAIAIAAFAFTACSDVPEPYQIPGSSSGGGDIPEGTYVSESFETSFGSFTVKTIKGTPWVIDFKTAKATGYDGSATTASEAYLVSSPIDLSQSKGAYLEFDYILRYVKAGQTENKVFATSNYTGDPTTTKWTDITGTLKEGSDWNTFAKYQTNLPAEMIGQSAVVLAMYYSCTTSSSTIEIKNLKVIEGSAGGGGDAIEVTCAEAVTATNNLADNATSTETYAVTGYITTVVGNVSNNQQTFWMADTKDGGKVFEAYWANLPSGVSAFTVGMKVKITGNLTKYVKDGAVTPEIKNATVEILEDGGTPSTAAIEVTCAEAVTATNNLADNATSTETYAVTGYITTVVGNVSNNQQTFWMADTKDGGKVFEAYWANLPSGISAFTVGMKVKITGNLTKYVKDGAVTPEIKNATVEILEDGGTPSTAAIKVTCAEAVTATNKLADGATSTETYAVTGYITTVVGNVSNNQQTFWMADTKDGGKVFEAYWANLPSGVSAFTVGMKVKITGNLMKYVKNGDVTPEIKNATVEVLEGGEGGGESGGGQGGSGYGTLSGNVLTLNCAGLGLENNPASIALVDGTTITLAKNDGNNNPAYNGSFGELRFYARNSFTINAGSKTIASVKLYCTLHNDNPGVGNDGEVTASSGTLDIQKEAMTIEAKNVNNSSFTLTNGYAAKNSGGIQIRFSKMEITYAN